MTTRTRLWLTILGGMVVICSFLLVTQQCYRRWSPQFNAQLSDLKFNEPVIFDSHYNLYKNNELQSKLFTSAGEIIKTGKDYEVLSVDDLVFVTSHPNHDLNQPIQVEQLRAGQLEPFSLPADFTPLYMDIQPSPDQRYWLVHGFLPEQWYLYNPATQVFSENLITLLSKTLTQSGGLKNDLTSSEITWLDLEDHTLYINVYEQETSYNLAFIKQYQFDAADQQFQEIPLEIAGHDMLYRNMRSNLLVDLIPLTMACDSGRRGTIFSNLKGEDYPCHQAQTASGYTVSITNPLIGKQKLIVTDPDGESHVIADWFSMRTRNSAMLQLLPEEDKVVVVANQSVGILDPATLQFAQLLELPFRASAAYNGAYNLRLVGIKNTSPTTFMAY